MTSSERRERWNERIALAVAAITLVIGAVTLVYVLSGNSLNRTQLRSDQITACRSSYRADIDAASLRLDVAQAASDELIRRGLGAVATENDALLGEIAQQAIEVDQQIAQAVADVADANRNYSSAALQSTVDPDAFLESCASRNGES